MAAATIRNHIGFGAHERGMTLWSLLYVLITLGLIALVAIRSVPVYINAYDIDQTLEWAAAQPDLRKASARRIQSAIQRRFDAGYVDNIDGSDIGVRRADGGGREIFVAYQERRPLLFNIDLAYSFEKSVRLAGNESR